VRVGIAQVVNASVNLAGLIDGRVVQMSVVSVEDHGYVMSFGVEGCNGFLRKKHAAAYLEQRGATTLHLGQPLFCALLAGDSLGHLNQRQNEREQLTLHCDSA
jgi:rRNA biogenesis protein RRP5